MQHFRDFEDPMVPGSDFEACQTYPEVRYWQAWDLGPAVATWYYVFWFKFKGEHPVQGWKWNGGGARLPLDAFVVRGELPPARACTHTIMMAR